MDGSTVEISPYLLISSRPLSYNQTHYFSYKVLSFLALKGKEVDFFNNKKKRKKKRKEKKKKKIRKDVSYPLSILYLHAHSHRITACGISSMFSLHLTLFFTVEFGYSTKSSPGDWAGTRDCEHALCNTR